MAVFLLKIFCRSSHIADFPVVSLARIAFCVQAFTGRMVSESGYLAFSAPTVGGRLY